MNFLLAISAAILQSGSLTLDKVILSIRKVDFKTYIGVSYPLIFLITLIIFLVFQPPLSLELFTGNLIWLILISVLLTVFSNIIYYQALDKDGLGEIQTITLLHFIPIIIFSGIFFADERNPLIIFLALLATFAVIWSHWEKNHFKIRKSTLLYLIWSLTATSIGALLAKIILYTWNPISFQLVCSGGVALILGPLYLRFSKNLSRKGLGLLILTNIFSSVAWILFYFSYQKIGIVYTSLIFCLQPLLVYLASLFLLKEKYNWKKVLAFFAILIAITIAQLLNS